MSEDSPIYNTSAILVTTDDGTLFSCAPHLMGGINAPRQARWKLIDARGLTYVGPPYFRESSTPADVHRMVSEWWEEKKALGQAGVNAKKLHGWLTDGR